MRSGQLLAQLALWASSAHAFYPFTPKWLKEIEDKRDLETRTGDENGGNGVGFDIEERRSEATTPTAGKAAREAARLAKKYGRRRASSEADGASVLRRGNNYDIMDAEETDGHLTAGIDQDGTDYSYFVKVQLGSSGKELHMLLDTGAGSSWVMGSDCDSKACSLHDSFGSDDSNTFESSDDSFNVSYGSGKVSGTLTSDTVNVAGMSFKYEFGVASEASDDFVHFAFDGILGLSMTEGHGENFLKAMDDADEVDANVFGVSLHRASDGTNDGEIKFGSPDKDRYTGDMTYTSIGSDNDDWAVELDDAGYDGKSADVGGVLAYIDTGTTFIFGPKDLVKSFHSVIPGAESSDGMSYKVPCDSDTPLTFTFSGKDFTVSPKDWISPKNSKGSCTSNVYGQEVVEGSWLLGGTFLKNVYAVFDKDKKRIGFAQHVDDEASSVSSATTSGVSTTMTSVPSTESPSASVNGTAKPSLGLGGQESSVAPTATDTGGSSKETDDSDSSSSIYGSSKFAFAVCIAMVFVVLV